MAPNQEIVCENDKNINCRCPMTAILNFTICGKTVPFTAWHTAELDSAKKILIETTNEVIFLKSAYMSLSRAIFIYFFTRLLESLEKYYGCHVYETSSNEFSRRCNFVDGVSILSELQPNLGWKLDDGFASPMRNCHFIYCKKCTIKSGC